MNRRELLKRAGLVAGLLALPRLPSAEAAPGVAPAQRDLAAPDVYGGSIVSSGGLCAPVSPYYTFYYGAGSRPLRVPSRVMLAEREAKDDLALPRRRRP